LVDTASVEYIAFPDAGFNLNTNNKRAAITVINKNGIDIINHAIMPKFC
jgi:hypothetical protein